MEITLDQTLCEKNKLKFGIIEYHNITAGESPQMLKGRLQLFQESIFFEADTTPLSERPGIKEWRKIFKSYGKNPSRYRPASEALIKRIYSQNYLPSVQSAIDLNNFFSLQYETPIGLYDLSQLTDQVEITIGEEADSYEGLNGRVNSLVDLLISRDQKGAFGSPFVDSKRTAVTTNTKHALQIVYLPSSIHVEQAERLTQSLESMFVNIHGGESSSTVLSCERCE
ncbi:B3/B4 domain-containing protein [Bacillus sp. 2205SS5-2]|uniref:B3/B4 domain-containing protein n=1 Tax=Bacillus sp. 2205SS5-2 TaxID=3109031 RepID=UPI0030042B25